MKYLIADYELESFEKSNLSELKQWIERENSVALDVETKKRGESTLKFDIHDNELVSIQIGNKWHQWFIDANKIDDLSFLDNKLIIGHNIKFDYQILKLECQYELKRVYDTMLGEYILNTGLSREKGFYSLEETHWRYFEENPYGNQLSFWDPWIPKSTRSNIDQITREVAFYGCTDIITTYKVWEKQLERIQEEDLEKVADLENQFVLVLGDMELAGMPIDIDEWLDLDQWATGMLVEAESKLRKLYPEVDNWNSYMQVGKLFKKLGIPIKNKDGKDSVNELVIAEHQERFPIIKDYLKYKQWSKIKSTYGIKFLKYVSPITGRVHSSFLQLMATGRISSTKPNMTNIINKSENFPEGIKWRKAFRCREGRTLVIADFSAQEARIMADVSNDKETIASILAGEDLHKVAASALYGIPVEQVTPEQRQKGKVFRFSLAYGAKADRIAQVFGVTRKEANRLIDEYFKKLPALKEFQEKTFTDTISKGYIQCDTIIGRKSYLKDFDIYRQSKSKKLEAEYFRLNANYRIQSPAASMAKCAGILLRKALADTTTEIVLLEHDCWIIECDIDKQEESKKILESCMTTAATVYCPSVPPPADAIISQCWNK